MVTLRSTSVDVDDNQRPRKHPRQQRPEDSVMPMSINTAPPHPSRSTVAGPVTPGTAGAGPGVPGGPRTTATSRRGGRTRARSPIVSSGGRMPGSAEPLPPSMAENPSSAAAAAAAAAKAFSDSAVAGRGQWGQERHLDDRGFHPMGYEKSYPSRPNSKWPGDDKSGGHYGHSYPYYGYDSYQDYPSDRRYRERPHGPYKGDPRDPGRGPPPPHRYHPDYRYSMGPRGSGGDHRSHHHHHPGHEHGVPKSSGVLGGPPVGGRGSSSGGTSLVIGGTTPIHVPKPEVHPEPAERPTRASAASVFRGRSHVEPPPPKSTSAPPPMAAATADDDEGPPKMLLSLKTPSTSFEEKKTDDHTKPKSVGLPSSPKGPPQIQSTSHQRASDMFERSPEGNRNAPAIDIAPSFTLFNQSFDSLGGDYFNVEPTLHADSFGMVRTASTGGDTEGMAQVLQSALSGGNGSTQLLAHSSSGHLNFGYSPVNSFGNASAAPPRRSASTGAGGSAAPAAGGSGGGGNMMILGGEGRSSSPTQVLSSYQSFSGQSNNQKPQAAPSSGSLEDGPMRMPVESFGANSFGRSYGEPSSSPQQYYSNSSHHGRSIEKLGERIPPFYIFLKAHKAAFVGCAFLLPGLKEALLDDPVTSQITKSQRSDRSSPRESSDKKTPEISFGPSKEDMTIARRRVESSVCAFGGGNGYSSGAQSNDPNQSDSIFRDRDKADQDPATITPSSSSALVPRTRSKHRMKYEADLPARYYENESRLSWEFEENPPVEIITERSSLKSDGDPSRLGKGDGIPKIGDKYCKILDSDSVGSKRPNASSPTQPKMRYRCKLCGQPKQNHVCPYQQSLARNIGIMVYPAINAFTAAEPGRIAPALSEMNNFTDLKDASSVNGSSPGRTSVPLTSQNQVTPESVRSSPRQLNSPPTTPGRTPTRNNATLRRSGISRGRKRTHGYLSRGSEDQGDLLFVEAMELKPQQFLTVTEAHEDVNHTAFTYPPLPLPYAQRKRLSDNLFSLSNEVPKLTDECAQVLREAREKDKWDLAVAELMTQVIVVLHCREGDHQFEGLRHYLLTLGIAC